MITSTATLTSVFPHHMSVMIGMNVVMEVMRHVGCVYLQKHCAMECQIVQTLAMN